MAELPDDMLDRIAAMLVAPMAHVNVKGRRGEVMAAFVRRERENQMRKLHIVHLTAVLAAAAISLPLLVSTSSAFAASPRTTARVGTQLAGLKGHALPQASSVGSVSFVPSDRQGAASATWTVGFTTGASGTLAIGGTITINAPASTTFPSAASAYKVNGTTVTATPTTAAGTVTIATPAAVANSSAISVAITGVTNPTAGTYANTSFSVSTSADTVASNPASGLSFGSVVSGVSFSPSSPVSAVSANWTVGFTTGASGALAIGGTITINAPASTTFPSAASAYKVNGTTVTATPTTAAGTVTIATPAAVANSSAISVAITGVTNPTAGTYANTSFSVSTSADTVASNPASGLSFGSVVSGVSFSPSSPVSAVDANWTVGFTTGASGTLAIGGTITINAPASTTFPSAASAYKVNGTTVTATPTTAAGTVTIATPAAVANSSAISVAITGVTNPTAGTYANTSFSVSTGADTVAANPASGQSFSVGSANTTTGLGLSSASVAYDAETSEIFTVTVTGLSGDGYPEGTVAVYNSSTKLCGATLTPISAYGASVTCSLTAHELAAGSYSDVFAIYGPGTPSSSNASYAYGTSSSTPVQAFSVGSVITTTGLGLSSASVAYDSETSEIFTVTVTGQTGDGHPEGTVAVYNSSTKLCGATLIPAGGHSASATCSLTAHELAAGSYSDVFAIYSPGAPSSSNASYAYGTSSSTPVQAFSVGSVNITTSTTTSLELSARRVTYGDEQVEQLSGSVSPPHSGTTPAGTVMISGANCQITLSAGKGSCTLPPTYFSAGNRNMVATYLGSSDFKHSASAKRTVTIDTATTTTSLELSVAQVTYGHEQVEQLSVSVFAQYPGTTPTGTVTVSGANCQIRLSLGKGSCTVPAHYFRTGHHLMNATYNGSRNFRRSVSATQTIAVVK